MTEAGAGGSGGGAGAGGGVAGSGGGVTGGRRVAVRAAPRRPSSARSLPVPDDLYDADSYGETLLRSLMRAQLGVTLGVLLPAAAVVATYPLLSVLVPSLRGATVGPVPLSVLILGFGIYPPLVVLAFAYVRRARRVEERFVGLLRGGRENGAWRGGDGRPRLNMVRLHVSSIIRERPSPPLRGFSRPPLRDE